MNTYTFRVVRTVSLEIDVTAEDEQEAEDKAYDEARKTDTDEFLESKPLRDEIECIGERSLAPSATNPRV